MNDASMVARRALYLALTLRLEKDDAIQAVDMWQPFKGHEHNPLVGLRRYCQEVALRFGLQGREAELHLSIIKSLKAQGLMSGLTDSPDSTPPHANTLQAPVAQPPSRNDAAQLMQQFMQAVEAHVSVEVSGQYSPERWRQSLMQQINKTKSISDAHLQDWLSDRASRLQGEWPSRGRGTQLINVVYVVLAQWLGPVKADACFTSIVNRFEKSSAPYLRDIRSYL